MPSAASSAGEVFFGVAIEPNLLFVHVGPSAALTLEPALELMMNSLIGLPLISVIPSAFNFAIALILGHGGRMTNEICSIGVVPLPMNSKTWPFSMRPIGSVDFIFFAVKPFELVGLSAP